MPYDAKELCMGLVTTALHMLRFGWKGKPHDMRVATDVLNKVSRTADKG
jgi:hypothetical protein